MERREQSNRRIVLNADEVVIRANRVFIMNEEENKRGRRNNVLGMEDNYRNNLMGIENNRGHMDELMGFGNNRGRRMDELMGIENNRGRMDDLIGIRNNRDHGTEEKK